MSDEKERRRDHLYIEGIAETAACRAVEKTVPVVMKATFLSLGIDTSDPISVQRQMAYLAEATARAADPEVQRDRAWTRGNRLRCASLKDTMFSTGAKIVLTGIAILILLGFAAYFGLKVSPAHAHGEADWIMRGPDSWCCGPRDCFEVEPETVKWTAEGIYVVSWRGRTFEIPEREAKRAPHGFKPLVCETPAQEIRCLFVPVMGS